MYFQLYTIQFSSCTMRKFTHYLIHNKRARISNSCISRSIDQRSEKRDLTIELNFSVQETLTSKLNLKTPKKYRFLIYENF